MSEYTSEQYKYLLLKHLQRSFSFDDEYNRYYTYSFYFQLLDGITITKDDYNEFLQVLNNDLKYCAQRNYYEIGDVSSTDVEVNQQPLIDAFARIGIKFEPVENSSSGYDLTFTKPDGSVMIYVVNDGEHEFNINAISGQEYSYAQQSLQYYQFKNIDVLSLDELDFRKAGSNCYWAYNKDTTTMTISGNGTYLGVSVEEQIGSGAYTTLIIGGNIERLKSSEAKNNASLTTVVLLHAADFPLVIDDFSYGTQPSFQQTKRTWDVYTDNEVFRNYAWPTKLTINWHSLNEWQG